MAFIVRTFYCDEPEEGSEIDFGEDEMAAYEKAHQLREAFENEVGRDDAFFSGIGFYVSEINT